MKCPASLAISLLLAAAAAPAAENAEFDRVSAGDYAAMLRDATHAYNRKDYAQAFPQLQRLACAGDKASQYLLGGMYILGQGTAKDDLTGYAWIKLAAEFSFSDYTSLAAKLEQALEPARREQGNAKAEDLRKRYGLIATGMSCHGEPRHGGYVIDTVICTPPSEGVGSVRLRRCLEAK